MMEPNQPEVNPTPAQQSVNSDTSAPVTKSNNTLIIIVIVLLVSILAIVIVAAIILIGQKDTPKEKTTVESTIAQEQEKPFEENQDEEPDEPEDINDIADLWDTYDNTIWKFRLKHPKAMTVQENSLGNNVDRIVFSAGSTEVFEVWLFPNPDMDTNLANTITNQCTDSINYGNEMFGAKDFRKAIEVPNASCLQQLGVQRTVDLASFGLDHPTGADWVLANHELIPEQLEGVLKSVRFY